MKFKITSAFIMISLVIITSCHEERFTPQHYEKGNVIITTLTDQSIIDEIQAMTTGRSRKNGAVVPSTVVLPPGYNYTTMKSVVIRGTSWVTYVAFSNTVNSPENKEMVAIYYQGGVFKNFILSKWSYVKHPTGDRYYSRIKVPEYWCNSKPYNANVTMIPSTNTVAGISKVLPGSACGQAAVNCFIDTYSQMGWLSLGLTLVSAVQPEITVGIMGGCLLGCLLYSPQNYTVSSC